MPLIRAFGRWLRRESTGEGSAFSRAGEPYDNRASAMVRTWFIILIAVLGIVPIVLTGSVYEGIRGLDRGNAITDRTRWIAAVVVAMAIGALLVFVLTRSA